MHALILYIKTSFFGLRDFLLILRKLKHVHGLLEVLRARGTTPAGPNGEVPQWERGLGVRRGGGRGTDGASASQKISPTLNLAPRALQGQTGGC